MNEWIKVIFGGLLTIFAGMLTWFSWMAVITSGWAFIILLILNVTAVITIGWWVLWIPMIMFFGGLTGIGINMFLTFLGFAIVTDI